MINVLRFCEIIDEFDKISKILRLNLFNFKQLQVKEVSIKKKKEKKVDQDPISEKSIV